jgi:predicted negative regulator of RcsB-dependent stress response
MEQLAAGYAQIASKYSGTLAGERAQLQAGVALFNGGKYLEAQAQFQNFLTTQTGSSLATLARSGVAASLEAQGKLDEALTAYRAVVTGAPDSTEAKFSQGRVLELQGKLSEAVTYYEQVARAPLAGSLASEAAQRIALIQVKLPVAKPATKS